MRLAVLVTAGLVGARQGHDLFLVDQALRVGQADFGLALGVPEHHFDLGAAQRGQAAAGGKQESLPARDAGY